MAELTWAVVIPAFNAAANIATVIQGCSRHIPLDRILVVDDGSEDKTADIAEKAGAQIVIQAVNSGKGRALRTGFVAASAWHPDWIICLDADGQHDPENIPDFQAAASTGQYGVIIGNRLADTSSMPPMRRFSNSFS
ncbi:glycosyltransferase family 2 protein, partial [bacterium]|nr:glycosyltransferase family 2 protein [bacterium]